MFTYCFNNEFISIFFISLLCILYFYDDERCKMNFPVRDNKVLLYCIVLYCIVLYCIVLYCIVLYCIVLYCIVLYCIEWYPVVRVAQGFISLNEHTTAALRSIQPCQ